MYCMNQIYLLIYDEYRSKLHFHMICSLRKNVLNFREFNDNKWFQESIHKLKLLRRDELSKEKSQCRRIKIYFSIYTYWDKMKS